MENYLQQIQSVSFGTFYPLAKRNVERQNAIQLCLGPQGIPAASRLNVCSSGWTEPGNELLSPHLHYIAQTLFLGAIGNTSFEHQRPEKHCSERLASNFMDTGDNTELIGPFSLSSLNLRVKSATTFENRRSP